MHISLVFTERSSDIKCGAFAQMKEELFSKNEMNQSGFFKIKTKGNVLCETNPCKY